ncbi:MAG: tRNA (adenosine(37)-N6)-threonylcarbamoyltransferase complex transferase subunit TsaD [Elusimicrobia bacterium GWC2_51_8]|nr:MAG: tRNA (adenosine(37)-N6)-threonylcarbamoyltransferase complex transferase subunit TsaD [Elusimicrobia bacterium GWA2_51_34]OGR61260.1 MAG: tRNA (adenosine(37)-N6)-threonylcarbamoyltransferase complex transferase subunit TsaD [Elusimicrobia bacterium GWC2_51_8]OGR86015.1 MAG: tRNA (adenosine(37)-N6)-threonylcarbamoyltransferase complex transferase subunit TsaD [Elusimicrobia bacterium GWF2_52_66]HAF94500.1 tRNA (adenosine(37)-N6)-threonylcarbamoyltransferase complex transferase subunit Tsa
MKILALETTCDETAAAVLEGGRLLSNVVFSQIALHRRYSGVVPELASRAHLEKIGLVLKTALARAATGDRQRRKTPAVTAVAFSRGPGLPGALMVGRVAAQAASELLGVPLIGVNHLEGHLLACEYEGEKLKQKLKFPLVALLVSGGHTELWRADGYGKYKVLGRTRDDAAGEAFDKVAKLLGLSYPGGPSVERAAASIKKAVLKFPRPYLPGSWDFSFSGLKTAVSYYLAEKLGQDFYRGGLPRPFANCSGKHRAKGRGPRPPLQHGRTSCPSALCGGRLSPPESAMVCRAFQDAVVETLVKKTALAARSLGIKRIAVGGGVSANGALRAGFVALEGFEVRFPEKNYCADNAAMIALCAMKRLEAKADPGPVEIAPDLDSAAWQ